MTNIGGLHDFGIIYSYDFSDSTFSDLYDFDHLYGTNPVRELMQASNGLLYGTTDQGGSIGAGVFFSYNYSTSTYTVLYNFDNGVNGGSPICDIVELPDNLTTGINPISNKESISIYPNPASSTISIRNYVPNLSGRNGEIRITDVLGNEIYHQAINKPSQSTIDISQWSNGVYFYQLTIPTQSGTETYRGKFVKE